MFEFEDMSIRYPVGEHSFRELRRGGFLYVDKTYYVARLITQGKFIFLSRPRRFGKSLMLSTIECFFKGEKELFEGTWIYSRVKEWEKYPVLHFDMSETAAESSKDIKDYLFDCFTRYEHHYDVRLPIGKDDIGRRFNNLIKSVHSATGKQVVILIDEYDKGILETLDQEEEREKMSNVLRTFYSQPKAATESVKFCMVTGVARFGSYSLFSGPNNYFDISMSSDYAGICGITLTEMLENFQHGITELSKIKDVSREEMIEELKIKYDSYRFTQSQELVFNPFSLLLAFSEKSLDNFWIKSGVSKVFVKYLSQSEFDIMELEELWVTRDRMEGEYSKTDSIPMLFQMGYLTIKEVLDFRLYRLGIPNGEVRSALVDQLMPKFMGLSEEKFSFLLTNLLSNLKKGDAETWLKDIQSMISKIPYQLFGPKESVGDNPQECNDSISQFERTYHLIIHLICQMIKLQAQSEVSMAGGRADMVIRTNHYIYVIEFKLDGTPQQALAQIDDKGYLLPYQGENKKVFKIGVVFSSTKRNITSWSIIPV